jgi:hypothetical protein
LQAAVRVEALHIFQVCCLALEQAKIVCKHFPIELLTNKLLSLVIIVLAAAIVVDVRVEKNELVPFLDVLAEVIDVLLAHIKEGLSAGQIIQHHRSANLVEQLLLEVLALIQQLLQRLSLLRQHEHLGLIEIVAHLVNFLDDGWVLDLPGLIVLLLE